MSIAEGDVLADIGCGNGKYFGVRPDVIVLGSDRSFGLAAQAAQRCRSDSRYQRKYSVESPPLRQSGPHQASTFNTDSGVASSKKIAGQESARVDRESRDREDPNGGPDVHSPKTVATVQNPLSNASPRNGVSSQLPGLRAQNADVLVADALNLPYKVILMHQSHPQPKDNFGGRICACSLYRGSGKAAMLCMGTGCQFCCSHSWSSGYYSQKYTVSP